MPSPLSRNTTPSLYSPLRFQLNKELDVEMIPYFLGHKIAGADFGKAVTDDHPDLAAVDRSDRQRIASYCDSFYANHEQEMQAKAVAFEGEWRRVERPFYETAREVFKGAVFPKGDYIAFVSMLACGPRFLDTCTFQLYWQTSRANEATASITHELMHFMFFDYSVKRHAGIFAALPKTVGGAFWTLSEVFNDVVLPDPRFVACLGFAPIAAYPAHVPYAEALRPLWSSNPDVDLFLPKALEIVTSMKMAGDRGDPPSPN